MLGGYAKPGNSFYDVEQQGGGDVLYPGISASESEMRWGLIQKVYGIVGIQLLLTSIVASFVVLHTPTSQFLLNAPAVLFFVALTPFIGLISSLLSRLFCMHVCLPVRMIEYMYVRVCD